MKTTRGISQTDPEAKTRRCSKCRKVKPFSDFYRSRHAKYGITYWCKICVLNNCRIHKKQRAITDKARKQREKIEVNNRCLDCGKLIGPSAKRCHPCAMTAMRKPPLPLPHCVKCGKELSHRACKLCSKCYTRSIKGDANPHWRGGRSKRVCEECGKEFWLWLAPSVLKRGRARFCSKKCSDLGRTGEKSSNWKGGLSFESYPTEFNEAFKKLIRERDNYTCAICGETEVNVVHHIDYLKANIISGNCIVLCQPCHAKTGTHRVYWQWTLTKLMMQRRQSDNLFIASSARVP